MIMIIIQIIIIILSIMMIITIIIITQYSIRVSAENSLGEGEPSGKQTVKTLQEAPEGARTMMMMIIMMMMRVWHQKKEQTSQF